MQPTKKDLLGLLADVDRSVPELSKLVIVGAGDTAMTLLDLKPPAIHLDFTGPYADLAEFSRLSAGVPNRGFQIHMWPDGLVFGQRPTAAWQRFTTTIPGKWRAAWDQATGVPSRIWGSGISVPGANASALTARSRHATATCSVREPASSREIRNTAGWFA